MFGVDPIFRLLISGGAEVNTKDNKGAIPCRESGLAW